VKRTLLNLFFIAILPCALLAQDRPTFENDDVQVVIANINVFGNKRTLDKVILTEAKINVGDSITLNNLADALQESKQNILNTNLFNAAEIRLAGANGYAIDVNITVSERWYIFPLPIFQTPGLSFSEWRNETNSDFDRVAYGIAVTHYNLRKRKENLRVIGKAGVEQTLAVSYFTPAIDKNRKWGIGFNAAHSQVKGGITGAVGNVIQSKRYDETAVRSNGGGLFVNYRVNQNQRHSFGYSLIDSKISDELALDSPSFFDSGEKNQRYGSLAYEVTFEHRDLVEYPMNGHSVRIAAGHSGLGSDDLDLTELRARVNAYRPLSPKLYASAQASARLISGKTIPFSNIVRKRLDDDLLRGYNDYRLFPESYAILQTELRYELLNKRFDNVPILPKYVEPLPLKIYPKVFFDIGNLSSDLYAASNPLNNDLLYQYGLGVDIVTIYNTPIRAEFGRNHLSENNVSFSLGKTF